MIQPSALSLLQHDELCEIRTEHGTREARWRPSSGIFFFTDGDRPTYCTLEQVLEWWPASVKL